MKNIAASLSRLLTLIGVKRISTLRVKIGNVLRENIKISISRLEFANIIDTVLDDIYRDIIQCWESTTPLNCNCEPMITLASDALQVLKKVQIQYYHPTREDCGPITIQTNMMDHPHIWPTQEERLCRAHIQDNAEHFHVDTSPQASVDIHQALIDTVVEPNEFFNDFGRFCHTTEKILRV